MDPTLELKFAALRALHRPRGSADIVMLRPGAGFLECSSKEIEDCIAELERLVMVVQLGLERPTALQRLAMRLLVEKQGV